MQLYSIMLCHERRSWRFWKIATEVLYWTCATICGLVVMNWSRADSSLLSPTVSPSPFSVLKFMLEGVVSEEMSKVISDFAMTNALDFSAYECVINHLLSASCLEFMLEGVVSEEISKGISDFAMTNTLDFSAYECVIQF